MHKLTITCNPYKDRSTSVPRTITSVRIMLAGIVVATRNIPGRWNENQAMKEFSRFPNMFTRGNAFEHGLALLNGKAA